MAKTRSRSRKSAASSTRAKGKTKTAGKRKAPAKRAKRPAALDLKKLRRDIGLAISSRARKQDVYAQADETQAALGRLADEIDAFCGRGGCGPTMLVPLA